jgi:ABC-type sulfate transport system substrate-binding protein
MAKAEKDHKKRKMSISVRDESDPDVVKEKNTRLNYQDISNKLQEKYRKEKLKQEEQEEERMIQKIIKNNKTCQDGGNNETITFDERMLDDDKYQLLIN